MNTEDLVLLNSNNYKIIVVHLVVHASVQLVLFKCHRCQLSHFW